MLTVPDNYVCDSARMTESDVSGKKRRQKHDPVKRRHNAFRCLDYVLLTLERRRRKKKKCILKRSTAEVGCVGQTGADTAG